MTELATGISARELIPGNPDELIRLAARLSVFGDGMSDAGSKLGNVAAAGWQGPAAEAFQGLVGEQPAKYRAAGASFVQASGAIRSYAAVLRDAQADAGRAVSMFEDASHQSTQWEHERAAHDDAVQAAHAAGDPPPAGPAPPSSDPGGADRVASQRLLGDARSAVRAQAQIAAAELSAAAESAPDEPGLLDSVIGGAGDFFEGVGDALSGAFNATAGFLEDAGGWLLDGLEDFGGDLQEVAAGGVLVIAGATLVAVAATMEVVGVAADGTVILAPVGIAVGAAGFVVGGAGIMLMADGVSKADGGGGGGGGRSGRGVDRGDGRDSFGTFTGKGGYGAKAEAETLKRYEELTGRPVIRKRIRVKLPDGTTRYYDGLVKNRDGSYTGLEVKSGNARLSADQRQFDGQVAGGTPAQGTLDGSEILIKSTQMLRP